MLTHLVQGPCNGRNSHSSVAHHGLAHYVCLRSGAPHRRRRSPRGGCGRKLFAHAQVCATIWSTWRAQSHCAHSSTSMGASDRVIVSVSTAWVRCRSPRAVCNGHKFYFLRRGPGPSEGAGGRPLTGTSKTLGPDAPALSLRCRWLRMVRQRSARSWSYN